MVEELVREFVPEALAAGLDFSGLQRVNPKFHIGWRSVQRRESDVIWRLPTREDTDIYLYLLIEFQSESDWWMAVRTQVYQGMLWQHVIDEKKLKTGAQLPPLLLVVLYNGKQRWEAPTEISKLIALSPSSALWPWQPCVRYHLLDMGAFPGDDLARRTTLAALLFRLEQRPPGSELKALFREVVSWFRLNEGLDGLRRLFAELIREAFTGLGLAAPTSDDLVELTTMMKSNLLTLGESWKEQWKAEGLAEGIAEGKAEGKIEGKAEALTCLLAERFGALTPSLRKRIRGAKLATLDLWFKRAIAAPDLASVFRGTRHRDSYLRDAR
jgi:hypothetical protein